MADLKGSGLKWKNVRVPFFSSNPLSTQRAESAKVIRAVKIKEVADFSFVDRARKELGLTK